MKIIMLGGSGFVGGHLARRLSRDHHQITIATRYAPGSRRLEVVPGVRVRQFDPFDEQALAGEVAGHDVAVNLIGILNERMFGGGRGFARAHVEVVEKLADACVQNGVGHLVQMSALNAGRGQSHYLKTRGKAEELLEKVAAKSGLRVSVFRPSTIFGPDDSFLNRFATLLRISPVLPLARPTARFAPVYVGDVAEAMARVIGNARGSGGTWELCGSEQWQLIDLVRWLRDQLGLSRAVIGLPDFLGRLQGLAFDLVPGRPFSSDNFRSLMVDSVCARDGFADLGIGPWGMSQLAPTWLAGAGKQLRYQHFRRQARRDAP